MSVKTIDVSIGRLVAQVAVASNFWWLDTDSGGMLGKRRTYLLAGIHPIAYQQVSAIGVHLLWLRLLVGWIRTGATHG